MANSLYKVHELMVKAGVELEEVDKKHIESIAEKAGDLLSKGMVKAAGASFDEIGEILNQKLREAGKEPIVFTNIQIDNRTLDKMVSMFADRISSSVASSIQDGIKEGLKSAKGSSVPSIDFGMDDQLKQLKADRQKLIDEYEKTKKLLKNKTKINDINKVLGENKELTLTGDLKQHTDNLVKQFEDAVAKMKSMTKGTKEYESAVLDAQSALDKLGAIQSEWHNKRQELKDTDAKYHKVLSGPLTKESIKKELELKAKLDQLKSLNIDKQIVQLSNLKMSDDAQAVLVAFGEISDTFDEVSGKLEQIETQIQTLNTQIAELENNNGTLKALEQIEKAYDRILKKRGKVNKEALETGVGYEEGMSLTKLANRYRKSERAGEDWENQYVWLVKFVEEYERVSQQGKKINDEHRKLYNDLQPKYSNASKSLDGLFNKGVGAQQGDVTDYSPELAKASEKEIEAKNDVANAAEEEAKVRMAIVKELAKHGTFDEARKAGGKKIEYEGQEINFGKFVSDYFKNYLGQSFSGEAFEKLWKDARAEFAPKFEPFELTKEDAIEVIREKVPDNILDGWFRGGDSSYKAKLEQLAMSDDDIRNAALNIMWGNFKEFSGKDIGFAEFLQSEIPMYRGKNQEKYVAGDETIAFTFDQKVAESFGKYVLETLIKPIETLGAYQTTGESEALVHRDTLEDRPEYQQWHAEMKGKTQDATKVNTDAVEKDTAATENLTKVTQDAAEHIKQSERLLSDLSSTSNLDKERFAYLNTDTGEVSPHIEGEYGRVSKQSQQELLNKVGADTVNATLHTHPELIAAPSEDDILNFAKNHALFKKNFILAGEQLAEIDFTSLSDTQAQQLADVYKQNVLSAENELDEKFNDTSFKNLGIESLDIDGILRKVSEQLMSQFPDLQTDIDEYIKNLRSMFQGANFEELSQNKLEIMLNDVTGSNFINTSLDLKSDIYQATLDIVNHASGIPSMYQEALQDIFTQTIRDLNFDPSKIFKLHNVNDFDAKLQTMRQQSMTAYQENTAAVKEATAAQKDLSRNVPSEDDIKSGKASWRGVPIQYDAALSGEARNLTDFMKVGPKFFGMDEDTQKSILDHEVAHNIADRIMNQATDEWEKAADIFAPKKQLPKGANPSFYTEEDDEGNRWYREGLYGDLGATALSETLTHALTEYFSNPDAFKNRSEGAFNYLEEYLNKSGDNLDNAAVDAVKEEIAAQEQLNAAKQEEQRIEQETAVTRAEASLDKLDELSDKAYDEVDADALNKILQERKTILDSIDESVRPDYADEIESHKQINTELEKRLSLLRDAQNGLIDVDDIDDIIKETGTLESKLERLDDVSYDWGMKIKDGEEDDAIDELEAFEETYDRIVLKLANGKKIEILPNAKGLRQLNKYQDGLDHSAYGETEIEDVIFERKKKEIAVQEELNDAKKEEQQIERADSTPEVVADNQKKIQSYEEVCEVVKQYNDLMHKQNAGKITQEENEELQKLQDRIANTRGMPYDDPYRESLAYFATFSKVVGTTTVDQLARYLGIEIPQAADAAKQGIEEVTDSLEKQQQVEKANDQVVETKAETAAQAELNEELKETSDLKNKIAAASEGGTHGQSLADVSGSTGSADDTVGANMQELQNVLSNITYSVKIVNDDTDKTANKIALDDSTLEATLNRVFANILNPVTEQNDGNVQEPWALESTLQTVKGVLDTIQTNTAKIGTTEVATVADDGILSAIKTAVESINKKIVQGTKVLRTSSNKKTEEKSADLEIKNSKELGNVKATKVDTRVKELQGLYEQRGKLLAQQSFESSKETQEEINQLNKKIQLKFKELNIEEAKRNVLKQSLMIIQDDAKQSERSLLIARKADRARLQAAKDEKAARAQAARDEKAELKARMKRDREENRVGASTSAWNAGNKALESLWKIDDKDKPLEQKSVQELMASLKELNAVRQRVNENLRKGIGISEEDSTELANKTQQVAMHTEAVKQLVKNYDDLNGANAKDTGHVFSGGDLETHLKNVVREFTNGQARIGDFDAATGRLKYTVQTGAYEFEEYEMAVREAGGAIVALQKGTKRTETFFESFKRKLSELTRYFSASSLIYKFFNEFRKGIQYIREIDAALVELRKVTDETEETYDEFLNTAAKTADKLGSTISQVTEATSTFAKLGYSMEMASEMAEAAIVYKNVGDNIASTEDAADSIISTLKGFGLEASESMRIVDRFNEVGNKFAITSQGLGEALRLSASALNEGGNTLDESIGIITAANEVVNDPSSVGTALKTLTLRLRGSKTELEEMGEDVSDMATTTSQLQAKLLALTGGQVDIMLDENTFKSSTQILREMAAAWESMTDIQQANALELMGGKRQANVLSALISNFDTAEAAIEASANSAGSALKENEVWLDSIGGRITQFEGAVQSMWKNMLNSDVVKDVVQFGTEIVKIIDEVGLLGTALIAISAYKGFGAVFGTLKESGITIETLVKKLGSYLFGVEAITKSEIKLTQVELQNKLVKQGLNEENAKAIIAATGLGISTDKLSRETLEATLIEKGYDDAQREEILTKIFGTTVTDASTGALLKETIQRKLANSTLVQYAIQMKLATAEEVANMTITQLLTLGFHGLAKAVSTATVAILKFLFTNPVGWVILAIGAIAGGIAIFNHFHKTTEELTEELNDLKSALQNIETELDSLNSELETTQSRMAELLALDKLSFTEKEELDNLRKQNDELQREIDLLNTKRKLKQNDAAEKFVDTMKSTSSTSGVTYNYMGVRDFWDKLADALDTEHKNTVLSSREYVDYLMEAYKEDPTNTRYSSDILHFINKWTDAAEGIDYGINDETDKWLDYVYDLEDKFAIMSGGDNAKTNAIKRIFNKEEFAEASEEIDKLVEQLEKDPTNQTIIDQISAQCKLAEEDLKAVGLSADAATEYFTLFASDANFNTLTGKTEELKRASATFENLLRGSKFKIDVDGQSVDTGLAELFDEEGRVIQTKLSQIFNNTSEQTRKDITSILESSYGQIKDGLNDAEITNLLTNAGIRFSRAILEIEKSNLASTNLELFPGLEDEIKGIIDTFDELISSVGSVVDAMDTLDQARAEEAYSGSMSLETLGKLMQSTENYADLIEVDETGAIKLATNAQDILVQQKIDAIKQNANAALAEAELALQEAIHAEQTYTQTGPAQDFLRKMTMKVGGAVAFVSSLWNDIISGNWDGAWDRAKAAQQASVSENESQYAAEAAEASVAVEEAKKNVADAEKMKKIADGLTPENIKSRYSSDDASGDNGTVKDVENDKFQQEMDYWENRISANQAKYEQIQNEIDLLEAKGMRAGEEYYREQIELENERKSLLEQQKAEALKYLGTLKEGSDEWWEVANTINDIEGELDDVTANVQELNDAIGQIRWDGFEQLHDRFSNLTSDLENIRDILSNEDMFDDEGNFTKEGVANLATYIQELEIYKNALADVKEELVDFQQGYEGNEDYFATIGIDSEQEYYDKLTELTDKQDEYTKVIKDSEQSVVEMYENQIDAIEEYIGELIDGYNDYIDVVKESLDAERDLYEFKKKIKNQTKDIASLERRIASLSGSTNASDIAERRKLEAELYEAKEGLNDTYYDHAKDSQSQALDEEAQAYEESMNKYAENLRTTLEEAQADMSTFLSTVTNLVVQNAGSIESTFKDTGLALDSAIVDPWTKAAEAMVGYEEGALSRMNDWTKAGENGYFYNFSTNATSQLQSPWSAGTNAANTFVTSVQTAMGNIYKSVESNVDKSLTKLSELDNGIKDSNIKSDGTVDNNNPTSGNGGGGGVTDSRGGSINTATERLQAILNHYFGESLSIDGDYGPATTAAVKRMQKVIGDTYQDGLYTTVTYSHLLTYLKKKDQSWLTQNGISVPSGIKKRNLLGSGTTTVHLNAKGTLGTKQDGWNITDESWIGEEITLAAGKNGQLQYLKKGSAVMPADISANLVEWGKLNPNMLNVGGGANLNMISNAINKPEINLDIAEFLHVDKVDRDTMPELEKFVDKKMNDLVRQLNYSIKKFK